MRTVVVLPLLMFATQTHAAEETLRRHLVQGDGHYEYQVSRRAPTLYMVSRDLYGTETKWSKLAEWNALVAPYRLTAGQTLSIRAEPTLTEEQGDEALASAWSRLGNADLAAGLRQRREPAAAAVAPTPVVEAKVEPTPTPAPEAKVVEAAPVPVVAPPVTQELRTAEPASSVTAPVAAPEAPPVAAPETKVIDPAPAATVETPVPAAEGTPAPVAATTPAPVCTCPTRPTPLPLAVLNPDDDPNPTPPWPWQWRADLIGSMFHLRNSGGGAQNDLYSRLNYGLEVEALYRFTNTWGVGAMASTEHVTMEPANGSGVFRQSAKDLNRVGLLARFRPLPSLALHAGVTASERPLPLTSTRALVLHSAVLPEFSVGADLPFVDAGWSAAFVFEGLVSAPVHDKHFDVQAGYGLQAGVRAEIPIGAGARATLAPRVRYLVEDVRGAQNRQTAGVVNLGVTW